MQTAAREAALEAARGTTRDPSDFVQRDGRKRGGIYPSLARHVQEGALFGEEIASRVSLLRPDGTLVGLYASATEALEAASAGCTLCLPTGAVHDNLVIRQPVRIVSRDSQGTPHGARDKAGILSLSSTIISRTDEPAITVLSQGVTLIGLALQSLAPAQTPRGGHPRRPAGADDADAAGGVGRLESGSAEEASERSTVLVLGGGELTMEHCLIRSNKGPCVCVSGAGSSVTAKMCKVEQGAAGGVLFENGAGGFLSECDIAACKQYGVLITSAAEPVISACQIHDGTAEGIIHSQKCPQ